MAGFGGDINLTLGIATDGTITGLQVGENSESEGYGKAIEQPEYTAQYAGISADTASLDAIDGISGRNGHLDRGNARSAPGGRVL